MIIKSMSRKEPSFGQLLAYVSRDAADSRYELRHNILSTDIGTLTAEYEDNAKLLPKRKNGVVMYHEIISITRAKALAVDTQKEVLRDIALDYLKQRAPQNLGYGVLHDDKSEQLHFHLVISANGLGSTKRHRLERKAFRQIQVGLEQRVLALHPELEQSLAIGKRAKPKQLSQPGVELNRRTGATPPKDALKTRVAVIFADAQSQADFFQRMTDAHLEIYRRGSTIGIRDLDSGRNHRLATLGLVGEFKTLSARIETDTAKTLAPKPLSTVPVIQSAPILIQQPAPPVIKESKVNFLEAALQGIGAVIDTLSITRDTGKPLEAHKLKVADAVRSVTSRRPPAAPNPPVAAGHASLPADQPAISDADRIAQERLDDMVKLRADQAQQRGASNTPQAKR